MQIEGLHGFLKDLEFAFGLPALAFLLFVMNIKLSRTSQFDAFKLRAGLGFSILLFLVFFPILMIQDAPVIRGLWQTAPITYSFVYLVSLLLIVSVLTYLVTTKLRPSLWSLRNPESNA